MKQVNLNNQIEVKPENAIIYHLHTDLSNPNMVEVVNKYNQYVDRAKELGMKAIGFSEHGNVLEWYKKKEYVEKNGMKYIHGCEIYVTRTIDEAIRDNYHMILIAKNHEGFKELNRMVSTGFNRETKNYYYNPRITWEDIKNTSDNIIITTACLGGVLWQAIKEKDDEFYNDIIKFMSDNKHRVFLEVQPHVSSVEQKEYNKRLVEISKEYDIPLIAGSDTHALNDEYDKVRKVLQKSKKILFTNEDEFNLNFRSHEEFVSEFEEQGVLTKEEYNTALSNTVVMANMIEPWKVDKSKKYPQIYDNPEKQFKKRIAEGLEYRKVKERPKEEQIAIKNQILLELETYRANDAINYMLLEDEVKTYARSQGVRYGYGRGSASGSIIAYLMQITEMDSLRRNLNFARFMSKERISLADIDTDYPPQDRYIIQNYLFNHPKLNCYHIVTFNTLQLKGAIKDMGRGLDLDLDLLEEINENLDEKEQFYREEYPELFHYVDMVIGVVVSAGQHACGHIVTTENVAEEMGLMTVVDSKTKEISTVTQINMKEIDAQNYVKLDLLSLDTVGIISRTVDLIDDLSWEDISPDNINYNDKDVIDAVKEDNTAIFQFESDFAHEIYKKLFSKSTIEKIQSFDSTVDYMDLLSLANGLIRPSANSFRDSVTAGEFYDNGHEALNKFLAPSLGRLVYQEQIIDFLKIFCGYSGGQADVIRRAIGKKEAEVIKNLLPEIEDNFVKVMEEQYDTVEEVSREIVKPFIKTIIDASDYGFSVNHSDAYSHLSFNSAWLRYYYPLEFLTASLNQFDGKKEKTKSLLAYTEKQGIEIRDIEFGHSTTGYMLDKKTNSIYRGIKAIKFLNKTVGDATWERRNLQYNDFLDVILALTEKVDLETFKEVMDIESKAESKADHDKAKALYNDSEKQETLQKNHMEILIKLGFFKQFGGTKYLLDLYEIYQDKYKVTHIPSTKLKRIVEIRELMQDMDVNEELSLIERCRAEFEFTTKISTIDDRVDKSMMMCTELKVNKNNVRGQFYQFNSGKTFTIKVDMATYRNNRFEEGDVVSFLEYNLKKKSRKRNGKWVTLAEKELWGASIRTIKA